MCKIDSDYFAVQLLPNPPSGLQDLEVILLFPATLILSRLNIMVTYVSVLGNSIFIIGKTQIGVKILFKISCFRNSHK
jgi:hypothetical protein